MVSETHEVRLTARDQLSNAFRLVGREATSAGQTVDRAFDQVKRSATEANRSVQDTTRRLKDAKDAGRDLAIGMGALAGAFTLAARSNEEGKRQVRGIGLAYGDAKGQILAFSDAIQDNTNFTNDAARAGALLASTLTREYGLSADQAQQLIARSADLAEVYGYTLPDAVNRTASAVRGEAEAAEALGVAMADSVLQAEAAARGMDGWTTTMTEAEKAAVRFDVLMEQTAFSQGAAAAAADTTRGRVLDLAHTVQDSAQNFADWTGVTGEAVAAASEFTLQIALMGGGLVKLGSGLKGLSGAAGLAGLAGTLGPIGLAGAALAAGAAFLILRDNTSALEAGLALAEEASASLRTEIDQLAAAGDSFALIADALGIKMETLGGGIKTAAAADIPTLTGALDEAQDALSQLEFTRKELLAGSRLGYFDTTQIIDLDRRIVEQMALVNLLSAELTKAEGSVSNFANAELALAAIFDHAGVGAERARANAVALFKAFDEERITADQLSAGLIDVGNSLAEFDRQAIEVAASTGKMSESSRDAADAQGDLNAAVTESNSILGDFIDTVRDAGAVIGESARTQGTGDKVASWLGLPPDWRQRLDQMIDARQAAAQPPALVSGAKEVTATIIPTPIVATPDPMIITFYNDLERAYANIAHGALLASEAQTIFKASQDGLIASQDPYNHQLSEYNGQLSAITAAVDQIQAKQEAGIEISAREQAILDGSTDAIGRLTGGVEDATLARAELAIQYAEQMKMGDQLNANMKGQQEVTGALVQIVKDLILSLDGVPEDVKTDIRAIDNASGTISSVKGQLDGLDGKVATTYVDTIHRRVDIGFTQELQHGGLLAAQHGRLLAHEALVGEAGREILSGRMVVPHSPSERSMRERGRGGGGDIIIRGPVYVTANNPVQFARQMRAHAYAEGRTP